MLDIIHDNWLLLLIGQYPNGPLGGLAATLLLAVIGLILAFPCALALAIARVSPFRPVALIATALINIVRGTPFLMVIFWSYFALPLLIGIPISGFWTLIGALVLYESAYLAEVIRSGIQALPKGQTEAARSLGFGYFRTMFTIILPQALYNSLPSLLSQFVSLIKETSLGYVISVNEFTFAAVQVNNELLTRPIEVFSILAITYFLLCFTLTSAARALEGRIARRRAGRSGTRADTTEILAPDLLKTEPTP
ncbi:amino acid ABC transporter permease [Haematobacter massiliensis]|uniref:Amino acid ABC transporter permease n=1 Tax=Haematobacter massiliensis TaxID=195105 RepID=A0A086Y4X2_9RHOB|nr:amino acid ABC transporter permease [Haematobacter massiliensis]KFI29322.1 amino acid ABC transporter permease [Haematobacter massiliensis]OWJ69867.1 amino acid ABC transporter permease [Haematobacter massiliensis]OWJ83685.1 amino acid ABC transporter permease [Haematobacter massiliensis]QBJ25939.1 amino acid ABC transporter permease [Haematobacter massiliensis]